MSPSSGRGTIFFPSRARSLSSFAEQRELTFTSSKGKGGGGGGGCFLPFKAGGGGGGGVLSIHSEQGEVTYSPSRARKGHCLYFKSKGILLFSFKTKEWSLSLLKGRSLSFHQEQRGVTCSTPRAKGNRFLSHKSSRRSRPFLPE